MAEYTNIITEVITSSFFWIYSFASSFRNCGLTLDVFTQNGLNIPAFKELRGLSKGYEYAE